MPSVTLPRRGPRGQALVEFSLVLVPLFLIICGIFDLGRAVFDYNSISEAARQANRVAIVDQNVTDVTNEAIAYATSVGLSASNVTVCFKTATTSEVDCSNPSTDSCSAGPQVGCLAFVTVTTMFYPVTPPIGILFSSGISISSTSVGPIEYVCPSATKPTCP